MHIASHRLRESYEILIHGYLWSRDISVSRIKGRINDLNSVLFKIKAIEKGDWIESEEMPIVQYLIRLLKEKGIESAEAMPIDIFIAAYLSLVTYVKPLLNVGAWNIQRDVEYPHNTIKPIDPSPPRTDEGDESK
jgi:hypothetical protein